MRQYPSSDCITQLELIDRLLPLLQNAFRVLETKLGPPALVKVFDRLHPRYREQTPNQAALQKLARYLSGLKALQILLSHRMLQEDGIIKRTLDELQEDILFLVTPPENPEEIALRERFLASFYHEEFNENVLPIGSTRIRDQGCRTKIRAYVERRMVAEVPKGKKVASFIYQTYSGYVLAASPQVMEMYSLDELKFGLTGNEDIDLFESHVADAVSYFVRGCYLVAAIASVFGEPNLCRDFKSRGDRLMDAWK